MTTDTLRTLRWCLRVILASGMDPQATAPRRPIPEKERDNILKYTPVCRAQGFLTEDAAVYLTSWVQGTLTCIRRPTAFQWMKWRWLAASVQASRQLVARQYEGMDVMRGVRVERKR